MTRKIYPLKVTQINITEIKLWTGTDFPRLKLNRNARSEKPADTILTFCHAYTEGLITPLK